MITSRNQRVLCATDRNYLYEKQKGKCFYCGCKMSKGPDDGNRDPKRLTTDHKKLWSKGGKTNLRNCVAACRKCNDTRSKKLVSSAGGRASAKKLTKKQRSEKARSAAQARWFKPEDVVL